MTAPQLGHKAYERKWIDEYMHITLSICTHINGHMQKYMYMYFYFIDTHTHTDIHKCILKLKMNLRKRRKTMCKMFCTRMQISLFLCEGLRLHVLQNLHISTCLSNNIRKIYNHMCIHKMLCWNAFRNQ